MIGNLKRSFVVPYKFYPTNGVRADMHVPDDRLYWVDDEGHVHVFHYEGRLIDQPYEIPVDVNDAD